MIKPKATDPTISSQARATRNAPGIRNAPATRQTPTELENPNGRKYVAAFALHLGPTPTEARAA